MTLGFYYLSAFWYILGLSLSRTITTKLKPLVAGKKASTPHGIWYCRSYELIRCPLLAWLETVRLFEVNIVIPVFVCKFGWPSGHHTGWSHLTLFNSFPLRRHFADDIFKYIFMNEKLWISIKFSLNFIPEGLIDNKWALVQVMAWRRRWTKADLVHRRIYAALGGDEFKDAQVSPRLDKKKMNYSDANMRSHHWFRWWFVACSVPIRYLD